MILRVIVIFRGGTVQAVLPLSFALSPVLGSKSPLTPSNLPFTYLRPAETHSARIKGEKHCKPNPFNIIPVTLPYTQNIWPRPFFPFKWANQPSLNFSTALKG